LCFRLTDLNREGWKGGRKVSLMSTIHNTSYVTSEQCQFEQPYNQTEVRDSLNFGYWLNQDISLIYEQCQTSINLKISYNLTKDTIHILLPVWRITMSPICLTSLLDPMRFIISAAKQSDSWSSSLAVA
jgi:hypothetical protein